MWIPDDAVEAAAKAIFECRGTGLNWDDPAHNDEPTRIRYRAWAQAALDAAIPHVVAAQAARRGEPATDPLPNKKRRDPVTGRYTAGRRIWPTDAEGDGDE